MEDATVARWWRWATHILASTDLAVHLDGEATLLLRVLRRPAKAIVQFGAAAQAADPYARHHQRLQ
jgi:hypothetical protein